MIHFLVRKGNEGLLANHPAIDRVWVWDKRNHKHRHLLQLIQKLRKIRFSLVFNLQRFGSTGFLTWRLRADQKVGFSQNPFAFCYDKKIRHEVPYPLSEEDREKSWRDFPHEVDRNLSLLEEGQTLDPATRRPQLYPSAADEAHSRHLAKPHTVCGRRSRLGLADQTVATGEMARAASRASRLISLYT